MSADTKTCVPGKSNYHAIFRQPIKRSTWDHLDTIGNLELLDRQLLGFFCSSRCPGDVILRVYDAARELRNAGVPVIGGFHTPMEKECLNLLLRGSQPIVICPARSLHGMRIPSVWKPAIFSGCLLLLSPFESRHRRITADLSVERNRLIAKLAAEIFVAHAPPGSKTEDLCRDLLAQGRRLYTFDLPSNAPLVALGVQPVGTKHVSRIISDNRVPLPRTAP